MVAWRTCSSSLTTCSSLAKPGVNSMTRRCYTSRRLTIAQLLQNGPTPGNSDCKLIIDGFVSSVRKQKRVAFAAVSDGSCLEPVQVVMSPAQAERLVLNVSEIELKLLTCVFRLSTGAAISVTGMWKPCPPGKEQNHELQATDVQLLGQNDATVRASSPFFSKQCNS